MKITVVGGGNIGTQFAEIIFENAGPKSIIGFVPGNGGFELAFRKCIERGNVFFGIDRVPAIARLTERGREVCCSPVMMK